MYLNKSKDPDNRMYLNKSKDPDNRVYLNHSQDPENALRHDYEGNHGTGEVDPTFQDEAQPVGDVTDR